MSSEIKARQSAKIRQLAEAAKLTGLQTLDELASAFGIPRSTAFLLGQLHWFVQKMQTSISREV